MPLAVLDLGSNSFHLSVFAATGSRVVAPRREVREPVRLGASLEGGRIDGAGFARGLAAVARLVRVLELDEPGCRVVAVATSAIREADNGRAFADEVARRHGITVEILGGEEEARATFAGARAFAGPLGRLAVVDLGGGSLEIASGVADECDVAASLPLGVLRLRDVHVREEHYLDVQTRERVAATVRFAAEQAARAAWDRAPDRLLLTSGTARALGALARELGLGGGDELTTGALERMVQVMAQFRPTDLPALGVEASRSDTIAIGAVVLHTMMQMLGFERAGISPFALREGVAARELRRGANQNGIARPIAAEDESTEIPPGRRSSRGRRYGSGVSGPTA